MSPRMPGLPPAAMELQPLPPSRSALLSLHLPAPARHPGLSQTHLSPRSRHSPSARAAQDASGPPTPAGHTTRLPRSDGSSGPAIPADHKSQLARSDNPSTTTSNHFHRHSTLDSTSATRPCCRGGKRQRTRPRHKHRKPQLRGRSHARHARLLPQQSWWSGLRLRWTEQRSRLLSQQSGGFHQASNAEHAEISGHPTRLQATKVTPPVVRASETSGVNTLGQNPLGNMKSLRANLPPQTSSLCNTQSPGPSSNSAPSSTTKLTPLLLPLEQGDEINHED